MAASKDEAGSRLRNRISCDPGVKSKGRYVNILDRNILMLKIVGYNLLLYSTVLYCIESSWAKQVSPKP